MYIELHFFFFSNLKKLVIHFICCQQSRNCFITKHIFDKCAACFRPQRVLRCCWCDRILAQTQLLGDALPPGFREAVFESRSAGTTRGDGIKENMSDKHNQQPLTSPFICLKSSTEEKERKALESVCPLGLFHITMNSGC